MKLETSKTTAGDAGASIATKGDEWVIRSKPSDTRAPSVSYIAELLYYGYHSSYSPDPLLSPSASHFMSGLHIVSKTL